MENPHYLWCPQNPLQSEFFCLVPKFYLPRSQILFGNACLDALHHTKIPHSPIRSLPRSVVLNSLNLSIALIQSFLKDNPCSYCLVQRLNAIS